MHFPRIVFKRYFAVMFPCIFLKMMQTTCKGILSGLHQIGVATSIALATTVVDVIGNFILVSQLGKGLAEGGMVTLVANFLGVVCSLIAILCLTWKQKNVSFF